MSTKTVGCYWRSRRDHAGYLIDSDEASLQTLDQVDDSHSQRIGDNLQRLNRYIAFTAFNLAHVCPIQAGSVRENILRPSPLEA